MDALDAGRIVGPKRTWHADFGPANGFASPLRASSLFQDLRHHSQQSLLPQHTNFSMQLVAKNLLVFHGIAD